MNMNARTCLRLQCCCPRATEIWSLSDAWESHAKCVNTDANRASAVFTCGYAYGCVHFLNECRVRIFAAAVAVPVVDSWMNIYYIVICGTPNGTLTGRHGNGRNIERVMLCVFECAGRWPRRSGARKVITQLRRNAECAYLPTTNRTHYECDGRYAGDRFDSKVLSPCRWLTIGIAARPKCGCSSSRECVVVLEKVETHHATVSACRRNERALWYSE